MKLMGAISKCHVMTKTYIIQVPSNCKEAYIAVWNDFSKYYLHLDANIKEAVPMKNLTKKVSKSMGRKITVYSVDGE